MSSSPLTLRRSYSQDSRGSVRGQHQLEGLCSLPDCPYWGRNQRSSQDRQRSRPAGDELWPGVNLSLPEGDEGGQRQSDLSCFQKTAGEPASLYLLSADHSAALATSSGQSQTRSRVWESCPPLQWRWKTQKMCLKLLIIMSEAGK